VVERDALLSHAVRRPVMLIEANPGGEWKIGAGLVAQALGYAFSVPLTTYLQCDADFGLLIRNLPVSKHTRLR
jgi:hypothetical protein